MLEDLAAGQVTLATVWLLGVSMGLTACTVTCLPFMGTWALGRASGQAEAFLHTAVYSWRAASRPTRCWRRLPVASAWVWQNPWGVPWAMA